MVDIEYPIKLKNLYFTRCIAIAIPEHTPNIDLTSKIGPSNAIDIRKLEDVKNEYLIAMRVQYNQDNDTSAPYNIDFEAIALFEVSEEMTEEEKTRRLTVTGHSVLSGAIREAVAWATARQPYGQLILGLSILTPAKPSN